MSIIRAEITGWNTASALGITATADAPVLKLCRLLVGAGHDPALPLHAYRGDTLCLIVCSIGEGAQLVISDDPPRFRRRSQPAGAPPIAQNGGRAP